MHITAPFGDIQHRVGQQSCTDLYFLGGGLNEKQNMIFFFFLLNTRAFGAINAYKCDTYVSAIEQFDDIKILKSWYEYSHERKQVRAAAHRTLRLRGSFQQQQLTPPPAALHIKYNVSWQHTPLELFFAPFFPVVEQT